MNAPASTNVLFLSLHLLLQAPLPAARVVAHGEVRAGLDTLYAGQFQAAADYFARLAAGDSLHPAPVVFQASALIWWAEGREDELFERERVDSLLDLAVRRARLAGDDFWLGTALGYRARQRELQGQVFGAARDAKAMRDAYGRVLARDSTCADCFLGLGVYNYALARVGAIARFFARLIGLGRGDAALGLAYMRRAAVEGDLARVEAVWVLASALRREAHRDEVGRVALLREARGYVERLAAWYPGNPVFERFLEDVSDPAP